MSEDKPRCGHCGRYVSDHGPDDDCGLLTPRYTPDGIEQLSDDDLKRRGMLASRVAPGTEHVRGVTLEGEARTTDTDHEAA